MFFYLDLINILKIKNWNMYFLIYKFEEKYIII